MIRLHLREPEHLHRADGHPGPEGMVEGLPDHVWSPRYEPCSGCGTPTTWVEINFGCRLCPGACTDRLTDRWGWDDAMAHLREVIDHFTEAERHRLRRKRR